MTDTSIKIVMMLLCGENMFDDRNGFFKICMKEPTDEDKELFINEIKEKYSIDNNIFTNIKDKYICKENICLLDLNDNTVFNMPNIIRRCMDFKEHIWKNK